MRRADAIVAGLVVLFALLAVALYDAVDDLGEMGRSLHRAGDALQVSGRTTAGEIRGAFGSAADVAGGLPVVGSGLADSLRGTGERSAGALERQAQATGRDLSLSGTQGEHNAGRVAKIGRAHV